MFRLLFKAIFRLLLQKVSIDIANCIPKLDNFRCTKYTNSQYLSVRHNLCFTQVFISVALRPDWGSWSPLTGLHGYTHWTGHILQDSSGRVITSSQRPLTTHNTLKRHTFMPPAGFEPSNFSKQAAADPRLRPRGH
jgi:hypothetical protein